MTDDSTRTVRVHPRREFTSADFEPDRTQFKDALVLAREDFDALFPDHAESGYVSVTVPGGDTQQFYAVPFSDEHAPGPDGINEAFLRLNCQQELGVPADDPVVEVRAIDTPDSGPLDVVRFSTRTESTRPGECRTPPAVLERLGVSDGATVELYNPQTSGRMLATIRGHDGMPGDSISLSTRARKLLDVEVQERADDDTTTTLHVRPPVRHDPATDRRGLARRLLDRILDRAVDYHEVRLRVKLGLNADEGRQTARVNEDTMDVLGIENGDRVIVTARTDRATVRCRSIAPDSHLIENDEDFEPADVRSRSILLPATERERANTLCDDVVRVRRDTSHIAAKSIVPSLLGFLGVYITGLQTIDLILPAAWRLPAFALTSLLSVGAVWIVLWPERQRCR